MNKKQANFKISRAKPNSVHSTLFTSGVYALPPWVHFVRAWLFVCISKKNKGFSKHLDH